MRKWVIINNALGKWRGNPALQRKFFRELAASKGFDPVRDVHRWYSITREDVISKEVFISIIPTQNAYACTQQENPL